jgi:hypothetical protein
MSRASEIEKTWTETNLVELRLDLSQLLDRNLVETNDLLSTRRLP